MHTLIKLEDVAKMLLAYLGTLYLGFPGWMFYVWLFVPDVSMIGYLINPRVGALLYNFVHHQGTAIIVLLAGFYWSSDNLQFAGLVLWGHSSMDRIFGYGLKYADHFKHTHLGWIGKHKE